MSDTHSRPPNALLHIKEIAMKMAKKLPVVVLDYDGTLTPIADRPELARLSDETRELLSSIAEKVPVAILSGRDRADVEKLVNVKKILYAGSHGFDMAGFGGIHQELAQAGNHAQELFRAGEDLKTLLGDIPGALVEGKKFGVAAHYRQVAEADRENFHQIVKSVHQRYPNLRQICGKMVVEFQPDIEWDKGKALLWILKSLHFNPKTMITLYIGDDRTDEDAFCVMKDEGIGICVQEGGRVTHADYTLHNPAEVVRFLQTIL